MALPGSRSILAVMHETERRNRRANAGQLEGKTSFISAKPKERRPMILAKRPLSFFLMASIVLNTFSAG
jgi:hypothetical protein